MVDRDLSGCMLGEFVLRERIGQGGYGVVYRSEQPLLDRDVVVKVLRKNDEIAVQRFLREARLASRFDHPFVAHVYAFGADEDKDLLWIAMELVHGVTLASWLEQHGPMPLEQFVPFFECVADAVHAAHECGIVHRDLKPSNVMVIERGSRLLPKLLDFGIAKTLDNGESLGIDWHRPDDVPRTQDGDIGVITAPLRPESAAIELDVTNSVRRNRAGLTRTGLAFGSRPYMSPEQWTTPETVGPASDIYSLGILAYEVLTGRLPYAADQSAEYSRLHRYAVTPPLGAGFSTDIDRVLGRALAKLPEDRHRSAPEMAAELREALQAQPREKLRSLAKVWNDSARSPALLLHGGDLLATAPAVAGDLERAFVAASHRRTTRIVWLRRLLVASAAVLAMWWYRGVVETRAAQKVANAMMTQSELEQGRSALLHNEPDAARHLAEAYRRDRSPSTAFMLARALQPRLAEQARFRGSAERMWSVMFSPDGKKLVTTDDKNAQVWDTQTSQLLLTLPHGDIVYDAVFTSDGATLITSCGDGAVRIWDAMRGVLLRQLQRDGIKPRYAAMALSPDEKLVAAIGMGGATTYVWNTASSTLVAELTQDASEWPRAVFSFDGRWLATAGETVRVFDTASWKQVHFVRGPGTRAVSWHPTGAHLLTGSAAGDVSLWSIPDGGRVHHLRDVGSPIEAVAFSPDGRLVVAASREGEVSVWDVSKGTLQSAANHLHGTVYSVEFDRTSTRIVTAGASGALVVTDALTGMSVTRLDGSRNGIRVAHFDPTSQRVASASWDGTARIWDATPPYRQWGSQPVDDYCALVTSLEPDQRFLAVSCKDHPTPVWDTERGELLAQLPSVTPAGGDFASAYAAISATGDRAAIARGSTVEVYEVPGGRLLRKIAHAAPVNTVAFASSGRDIVSGAVNGSLLVTRDNGVQLTLPDSPAGIDAAGFLPNGRIVSADATMRLRFFASTGELLANLQMSSRARTLRMSSNSQRLLTVPSFMRNVAAAELWDVVYYRRVAQFAEQGQIFSARFVGDQILTAWSDGTARFWDSASGQPLKTYRGGPRFLADVTLSSDGSIVIGGDGDGILRFWDATSTRPLWTMQAHRYHLVGVRVEGNEVITRGFSGDVSRWVLPEPERVFEACRQQDRCGVAIP